MCQSLYWVLFADIAYLLYEQWEHQIVSITNKAFLDWVLFADIVHLLYVQYVSITKVVALLTTAVLFAIFGHLLYGRRSTKLCQSLEEPH